MTLKLSHKCHRTDCAHNSGAGEICRIEREPKGCGRYRRDRRRAVSPMKLARQLKRDGVDEDEIEKRALEGIL